MRYELISSFAPGRKAHSLHGAEPKAAEGALLACYLAGWAEANPAKIAAATADGYSFHDPLVGTFTRQSLFQYFETLRKSFASTGAVRASDLAFALGGPMEACGSEASTLYWREAPALGLTGTARISVGNRGILTEVVSYDLNLASDLLGRNAASQGSKAANENWGTPARFATAA